MKRFLSVILLLALLLQAVPVTLAAEDGDGATYDRASVAAGDQEVIDALDVDQIAEMVLDWLDAKISDNAEFFRKLNTYLHIDMAVTDVDDVLNYQYCLSQLGGDFASLDTSALEGVFRSEGDVEFLYALIDFAADNRELLSRLISWQVDSSTPVFDCGNLGDYLLTLNKNEPARRFYENYILGNDLTSSLTDKISEIFGVKCAEDESLDEYISRALLTRIGELLEQNGLLSTEGAEAISSLRLEDNSLSDFYQAFLSFWQNDRQVKAETLFRYYMDNTVRPAIYAAMGASAKVESEKVTDSARETLQCDLEADYGDMEFLDTLSGGSLYYRAYDGKQYKVIISEEYGEYVCDFYKTGWTSPYVSMTYNTVAIGDSKNNTFHNLSSYTPVSGIYTDYLPTVYALTKYSEYVPAAPALTEDSSVKAYQVAGFHDMTESTEELVEELTEGDDVTPTEMENAFIMKTTGAVNDVITIQFDDMKDYINKQALSVANEAIKNTNLSVTLGNIGSMVTKYVKLGDMVCDLEYKGYWSDEAFVMQVYIKVEPDIEFTGNLSALSTAGITMDALIEKLTDTIQTAMEGKMDIDTPVATVVVENLGGSAGDGSEYVQFFNTDFEVNTSILDYACEYDYQGGILAQANRLLCGVAAQVLTPAAYKALKLNEEGNQYIDSNLTKLREELATQLTAVKNLVSRERFSKASEASGLTHGDLIYNMATSSNEAFLVDLIQAFCEEQQPGLSGTAEETVKILLNTSSLDSMLVGVGNLWIPRLLEVLVGEEGMEVMAEEVGYEPTVYSEEQLEEINTDAAVAQISGEEDWAKETLMPQVTEALYALCSYTVSCVNDSINQATEEFDTNVYKQDTLPAVELSLGIGYLAEDSWQNNMEALLERLYALVEDWWINPGKAATGNRTEMGNAWLSLLPMKAILPGWSNLSALDTALFTNFTAGKAKDLMSLFCKGTDSLLTQTPGTSAFYSAADEVVDAFLPGLLDAENITPSDHTLDDAFSSAGYAGQAARFLALLSERKQDMLKSIFESWKKTNTVLPYIASGIPTEPIVDHEHQYGTEWVQSEKYHSRICSVCGKTEVYTHTFGAWETVRLSTTTVKGEEHRVCSVCGYEETRELPLHVHTFEEWTVKKAATTEETGLETRVCKFCGEIEERIIPKHVHSFGQWSADETSHSRSCECGYVETEEHSYPDWTVTEDADAFNTGSRTRSCTVCGYTVTETIPVVDYKGPAISSASNATTGVLLKWKAVDGATKYRVSYKTSWESSWREYTETTGLSQTLTGLEGGVEYTFSVQCYNGEFWSQYGKETVFIYCPMPQVSTPVNTGSGVKLTWGAIDCADKYRIYYKASGETSYTKFKDTTGTSITVTGLTAGKSYVFAVKAYNGFTWSAHKATSSLTYKTYPSVTAMENAATGVKVTWSKFSGATKYRVYYKISGSKSYTKFGDVTGTSTTVTGLTSGKTYVFTVKAYANGEWSSNAASTGFVYCAMPKITGRSNAAGGVKVTWEKVEGATKYRVYYRKATDTSYKKFGDVKTTSAVVDGLVSEEYYVFTVRAYNGSTWSTHQASTKIMYLSRTSLYTVTNPSANTIRITWNKDKQYTGYQIRYSTSSSFTNAKTITVKGYSNNAYTLSGLTKGKTYYIQVRGYQTVGKATYHSGWSDSKTIKITR